MFCRLFFLQKVSVGMNEMTCISILISYIVGVSLGNVVMSIDLGNAFIKNGLIRPGQNPDLVHDEMGRKFASFVYISGPERRVAYRASEMFRRSPELSFSHFTSMLALHPTVDKRLIDSHRNLFPFYSFTPNSGFIGKSNQSYSIDEILTILLEFSVDRSFKFAGSQVTFTAIAIPNYYSQAQRRSLLNVGKLVPGDLKIDSLINANVATAYYYALFFDTDKTSPPVLVRKTPSSITFDFMVIDVGAMSVQASVFRLSIPNSGDKTPTMFTLSSEAEPSIGASSFVAIIRNLLLNSLKTTNKVQEREDEKRRTMARLNIHAERFLSKLSLLAEYTDEIDDLGERDAIRVKLRRSEFESNPKTKEILDQMSLAIKRALVRANTTGEQLAYVLAVGGGSRIPCVVEMIKQNLNRTFLDRRVNADDDVAMGSVFYGAAKSNYFVIKKIKIKDIINFGVRLYSYDGNITEVFPPLTRYPTKRTLSIPMADMVDLNNNNNSGLKFKLSTFDHGYGNGVEHEREIVEIVVEPKWQHTSGLYNGLNITVLIDENQIVSISKVRAIFEQETTAGGCTDSNSMSMLGNRISNIFGYGSNAPNAASNETRESPLVNKTVTVSYKLNYMDLKPIEDEKRKLILERLQSYKMREAALANRHKATNELQELTGRWRSYISDGADQSKAIPPNKIDSIKNELNEAYDWVDDIIMMDLNSEEGMDESIVTKEITDRLSRIQKILKPVEVRLYDAGHRQPAIAALRDTIGVALSFADPRSNLSTFMSSPFFSRANHSSEDILSKFSKKISTLVEKANDVGQWLDSMVSNQSKIELFEDPILTTAQIKKRHDSLERLMKKTMSDIMAEMFKQKTVNYTQHSNYVAEEKTTVNASSNFFVNLTNTTIETNKTESVAFDKTEL